MKALPETTILIDGRYLELLRMADCRSVKICNYVKTTYVKLIRIHFLHMWIIYISSGLSVGYFR